MILRSIGLALIGLLLAGSGIMAQTDTRLVPITPDNVANLIELAPISRGGFRSLQWSPVDQRMVILTDRGAWLYLTPTDEPIRLKGHFGHPIKVIFSPDGRTLAGIEGLIAPIGIARNNK
ncbi:MAG: hypothetical protein MUF87_21730 [Anaerolineae bacterium]|nr:hypothetical protein [Anaerolineae bacterium]